VAAAAAFGPVISGYARKVPTWPVYMLAVVPGAFVAWEGVTAIADGVDILLHGFGLLSLQFLLASLCITPLLRFARINLVKFRKALGLIAFAYLCVHFATWLLLDLQLRWGLIGAEIVKRPYLTLGFAAFVMLIPLAATSFQAAVKRMGARAWGRLHRLVYGAVLLGAVHFIMQEKVWTLEAILYLAAAILLVGMRLAWIRTW
jgi:sulfoxide reductase heme-binding subunit YedZ